MTQEEPDHESEHPKPEANPFGHKLCYEDPINTLRQCEPLRQRAVSRLGCEQARPPYRLRRC